MEKVLKNKMKYSKKTQEYVLKINKMDHEIRIYMDTPEKMEAYKEVCRSLAQSPRNIRKTYSTIKNLYSAIIEKGKVNQTFAPADQNAREDQTIAIKNKYHARISLDHVASNKHRGMVLATLDEIVDKKFLVKENPTLKELLAAN